jgi:hypothetical protein
MVSTAENDPTALILLATSAFQLTSPGAPNTATLVLVAQTNGVHNISATTNETAEYWSLGPNPNLTEATDFLMITFIIPI